MLAVCGAQAPPPVTRYESGSWMLAADEDTVRDVIRAFNQKGLAALDPRWAGGRPT
ncbi:MAG: helix-turn-helix domain-containing protein [Pseudonocardiaceae bacterium]